MQKIVPHLWFDTEAVQAAEFYVSIFPHSKIKHKSVLRNTPSGDTDIVVFELLNMEFQAISAGPLFKFNPSISFHVICKTKEEVDALWGKLSQGGTTLMELGAYPFSEHYGWLQDRYGLSWQLFYSADASINQKIIPAIMFVGSVCGRAEEAIRFWTGIFPASSVDAIQRREKSEGPDQEGSVYFASFRLLGQEFGIMDSAYEHQFALNEAISFMVMCENQAEIDHYWERLSAVPEAEQCGWLKDKFGLSWQIVPAGMEEMLRGSDQERIDRVTQAFLVMKKLDLSTLEKAYRGGR